MFTWWAGGYSLTFLLVNQRKNVLFKEFSSNKPKVIPQLYVYAHHTIFNQLDTELVPYKYNDSMIIEYQSIDFQLYSAFFWKCVLSSN